MLRVSVAERATLWLLLGRVALRKVAAQVKRRPRLSLTIGGGKADRLVIAPQDLRTADATRAAEIYASRFAFAGKVVVCDARSAFEMAPPSDEWATALLGFSWLRHLRAADSNITRANARALVDEWMTLQGTLDGAAWEPGVVARRIVSWLSQATLVLDDADAQFYRRFLNSLARQVHYLRRTECEAPDGLPRLQAAIALAFAALCMANQLRHARAATKRLGDELDRQILPDGGHISRNPGALIELLLDLLPLRQVYTARNLAPPPALLNAIDRMMPMLRFFRHGDGNFAAFHGMGPTPQDELTTLLAYDDARGTPVSYASYSGYQRLDMKGLMAVMDTGRLPPLPVSREAHASCLAFEFSSKKHRIVINCGLPGTGRDNWQQVARATAAHSTVTFNDRSSCRIVEAGWMRRLLRGNPALAGPLHVEIERLDRDVDVSLRASHDGYARTCGWIHQRTLRLTADGVRIDGEDCFHPAPGRDSLRDADVFAIRFHLHPAIRANRLADGNSVVLLLPNREGWTFEAFDHEVDLEESVALSGRDGPRRTTQIVIHGRAKDTPQVRWAFAQVTQSNEARRAEQEEPELPL